MTDPTPLSPAANAVWEVFKEAPTCAEIKLAAALRAAADQVVPIKDCGPGSAKRLAKHDVRYHLLAIATELEGAQ